MTAEVTTTQPSPGAIFLGGLLVGTAASAIANLITNAYPGKKTKAAIWIIGGLTIGGAALTLPKR